MRGVPRFLGLSYFTDMWIILLLEDYVGLKYWKILIILRVRPFHCFSYHQIWILKNLIVEAVDDIKVCCANLWDKMFHSTLHIYVPLLLGFTKILALQFSSSKDFQG